MTEALPAPLTPPDCDLRDFPHMQLDVLRLRDSDLAAVPDPEVFRSAVLSWCVAWHQVPAGSLPNDDAALCRLLGFGRDIAGWQKVREAGALRGYVLCSDGRLYHRVVAEKAIDAWTKKRAQRDRTEAARVARLSQRQPQSMSHTQSQPLLQTKPPVTTSVTEEKPSVTEPVTSSVTASKGEGEGEERRREESLPSSLRSDGEAAPPSDPKTDLWRNGLATLKAITNQPEGPARKLLGKLVDLAKGEHSQLLAIIRRCEREAPDEPIPWLLAAAKKPAGKPPNGHDPTPQSHFDAWLARQKTEPGRYQGQILPAINGLIVSAQFERITDAIYQAGATMTERPNLDALAEWCQEDIPIAPWFVPTIRRVAASLREPVRSLAVFDAALRERRPAA